MRVAFTSTTPHLDFCSLFERLLSVLFSTFAPILKVPVSLTEQISALHSVLGFSSILRSLLILFSSHLQTLGGSATHGRISWSQQILMYFSLQVIYLYIPLGVPAFFGNVCCQTLVFSMFMSFYELYSSACALFSGLSFGWPVAPFSQCFRGQLM